MLIGNLVQLLVALAAYLVIDWLTFTPSFAPLGITPWNPAIGFALALALRWGLRFAPLLVLGPLLTNIIVRKLPFDWWLTIAEVCLTAGCYGIALWAHKHSRWRIETHLDTVRDLLLLIATTTVAAFAVAATYNAVLWAAGLLGTGDLVTAVIRHWIGEVIGLHVMVPVVLLAGRHRGMPTAIPEMILMACSIALAITLVFGVGGQTRLHFSYVLFLPVMWVAVRTGLAGVAYALLVVQVLIMLAVHITGDQPNHVPAYQALMIALSMSGMTIGVLIDEQERSAQHLHRQQDAIAKAARFATVGEVTTSLAHELNQPLTAARNYGRAMIEALGDGPAAHDAARDSGARALEQIDRCAQIVYRFREFIRVGRLEIAIHQLSSIVEEAVALMAPDFDWPHHRIEVNLPASLPPVAVDRLQIEQVLINLLRNACEANDTASTDNPRIVLTADHTDDAHVAITIADSGRGFPAGFRLRSGQPIASTKSDGLGIGLTLCASIIERHGGRMEIIEGVGCGMVRITLPVARGISNG